MKVGNLFILVTIILIVIFESIVLSNLVLNVEKELEIEVGHHLEDISSSKGDRINDYLQRYRDNLGFLAESKDVKEIFGNKLRIDKEIMRYSIENFNLIYAKEIENYLLSHPEMTLKNLQESEEFLEIAVQPIGEDGYTAIHGSENLINYFHRDSGFVGERFREDDFPDLFPIIYEAKKEGYSNGYYNWVDINGVTREKFGEFRELEIKTADGIGLTVAATIYTDDYKIFDNVSEKEQEYFKDFANIKGYNNLIFISKEGYLAYSPNPTPRIGTNFNWEVSKNKRMKENYLKVKKNGEMGFEGPFFNIIYGEELGLLMSGIAPVKESGEIIGYIAIVDYFEDITEIMTEEDALGETGDTYLVNREKLLISPVRFSNLDVLIQSVENINVNECIEALANNIEGEKRGFKNYLDYRGEQVYGVGLPIAFANWCLIGEVDEYEIMAKSRVGLYKKIRTNLGILFIFTIIIFLIGRYLNKRYTIGKNNFSKMHKNIFNWKFAQRINLFWSFVIGLIFTGSLFYILSVIFELENLRFYDVIPDLFVVFVLILLLIPFFQFKESKIRFLGVFGVTILFFSKVAEIFMQEFQAKNELISINTWTIHSSVFFLGFFLLLFAVSGGCKK